MDLDEARAVIAEQHHAVLATLRSDGTPQMSPVVAAVDAAGRVVISTRQASYKVRNLRRNPQLWLCAARRVLRPVDPGGRDGGDRRAARRDGAAGGLLPPCRG